jgi:phosphoribosylformylglycinamidine cyclo-ligase
VEPLTYRDAGVDIEAGDEAVRRLTPHARRTTRPEVLGGIGSFASFVQVPAGYREPVLVSSTDGVGSKLKVAFLADRHDTVGIDLVAMGVNDVLVHGAEPLYFLDYIGASRVDPARIERIVAGVAEGCRQARCALVGGEIAELPDLYAAGEYDLAGFAVGVVEKSRIIDGSAVRPGDVVLGLASSGLHSNGFSLARRIVFDVLGLTIDDACPGTERSVADVLLEPTRIYVASVLAVREHVHAMAHITGGGLVGNLPRVLPAGCRAVLHRRAWEERAPAVFRVLQEAGRVSDAEMLRTFNMGIGYVLVVPAARADAVAASLEAAGERVHMIGEIVAGEHGVEVLQ